MVVTISRDPPASSKELVGEHTFTRHDRIIFDLQEKIVNILIYSRNQESCSVYRTINLWQAIRTILRIFSRLNLVRALGYHHDWKPVQCAL